MPLASHNGIRRLQSDALQLNVAEPICSAPRCPITTVIGTKLGRVNESLIDNSLRQFYFIINDCLINLQGPCSFEYDDDEVYYSV